MSASYRVRVISKHRTLYRPLRLAAIVLGVFGAVVAGASPASAVVSERPAPAPTFNGTVWTTVFSGNTIYVGGDFTAAIVGGRQVARSRLAAIDATSGALLSWAPRADAGVRALAVSGGSVYAAGLFTTVNGVKRDSLARVNAGNGSLHATFKHSISGKPYALAAGSGRLYLGGAITAVNGQTRTRLAAFDLSSGALDANWRPTADDQVEALLATSGRVYVGGKFHKLNGAANTRRLAAVSPTSGSVRTDFRTGAEFITYGIAVSGSRVYAAHGGQGGRLVAYEADGSKRWTLTTDGDPRAVAVLGDTVYVGGHFDNVCRSTRTGDHGLCLDGNIRRVKLAATDTNGELRSWTADGNGVIGVLALAASPSLGRLAAGGAFTTINGTSQKRFALFD
jgi:outer membrane protein assembly factor BamB